MTNVYSVHDSKVEAWLPPFYMRNAGEATRAFEDTVNDPKSQFAKHPEDFALFELGSFNDVTGRFDLYSDPKSLGRASDFQKLTV